ncbi:MAG: hypothetical protein QXU98_01690 [Candidatus Parvarchaeota archaeon]
MFFERGDTVIVNLTSVPVPSFFPDKYPVTIIWNEDGTGSDVTMMNGRYIVRLPKRDLFINLGLPEKIVEKYYDSVLLPFSLIHELLHIYYDSNSFSFDSLVGDENDQLIQEVYNFLEDHRIEQNAVRDIKGMFKYVTLANAITALRNITEGISPETAFLLSASFNYYKMSGDKRQDDARNAFRFSGNAISPADLKPLIILVRNALSEFYRDLKNDKKDIVLHINIPSEGGNPENGSSKNSGDASGNDSRSKNPFGRIGIDIELIDGNGDPKVIIPDEDRKALEGMVVDAINAFENDSFFSGNNVHLPGNGYSPGSRKEVPRTVSDASFMSKVEMEQSFLINYLREKYLQQKIRYQTIYRANEGDYDPSRIEETVKLLFLNDDTATPYEVSGINAYSRTDLCIVLDQSGSTSIYADDMATMAAVFLLAFKDFKEMRTCLISLKGDVSVCKFFDEPVEATSLYPTAEGGTPIATALELALKQNWQSELKFLVLVSDGIFPEDELLPVEKLKKDGINLVALSSNEHIPLFDRFIFLADKRRLAEELSAFILPEMIEGFYQEL